MMFAPGCRWIFTMTAGTSFIQAASSLSPRSAFNRSKQRKQREKSLFQSLFPLFPPVQIGNHRRAVSVGYHHGALIFAGEIMEVIWFKPGICPNCRSSGAVMAEAATSGLAPG